jgi:hypothetical protein
LKAIVLAILLAIGGWWYFIGGRTLTPEQVTAFYRDYEAATLNREPDKLCAMLADDFSSEAAVRVTGQPRPRVDILNKEETCESLRHTYAAWEEIGQKMGGMLQLDSNYTLRNIQIAKNRKQATVEVQSSLDIGGSIMSMRSRTQDTLVRRNGKVLLLRSEGTGQVNMGGA